MAIAGPDPERDLHDALEAWARDHAARFEDVGVFDYDPEARPEQRIDTFKTLVSEQVLALTKDQIQTALRSRYEAALGTTARNIFEELTRPRESSGGDSIAASIAQLLDQGKSVALLSPHADRLEDIGAFSAGLAVAFGDADHIQRNGLILNKVMTRELYKGRPMVEMFEPFGNIYWVIPETDAPARWGIRQAEKNFVNLNAMRQLLGDIRTGTIITFAPTGSVMRRTVDDSGELSALHLPPIGKTSARLMARFDAYAIIVLWRDQVRIGPLTHVGIQHDNSSSDRQKAISALASDVLTAMSTLTEDVAGVPVIQPPDVVVDE